MGIFSSPYSIEVEGKGIHKQYHGKNVTKVVEVSLQAMDRALYDGSLSPKEALQLEALRKTIGESLQDGKLTDRETQKIVAQAKQISPGQKGHPCVRTGADWYAR